MIKAALAEKHPALNKLLKTLIQNRAFYLMLSPGLVLLFIFHYLPMAGALIAFKRLTYTGHTFIDSFMKSKWVGLENFKFFLQTPDAFNITRNTILYNITFIILGLVFPVFCAIALNEITSVRLSKFYQSTMFLPYFLSWIVVSYLLFSLLNSDLGVMNRVVLKALGIEGISWYSTTSVWPFIFVILQVWKYSGYGCVIYFATISGIDPEYYEAATIDGASRLQRITKITIPLLKPVMIITTILAIGRIFNADFGLFYQASLGLGNGILKPVGDVLDTYVYQALINLGDIGMSSAAGLYQAVIGFFLVLASNLIVRKVSPDNSLF